MFSSVSDAGGISGGRFAGSPGRCGAPSRATRFGSSVVAQSGTMQPVTSDALASGELKPGSMSLKKRTPFSRWGLVGHGFGRCSVSSRGVRNSRRDPCLKLRGMFLEGGKNANRYRPKPLVSACPLFVVSESGGEIVLIVNPGAGADG
jgi:hypothetical protein